MTLFIFFKVIRYLLSLLQELRLKLDELLEEKISNPNLKIVADDRDASRQGHLLAAIIDLITKEEVQVREYSGIG